MHSITIHKTDDGTSNEFTFSVEAAAEDGTTTHHTVTLERAYYVALTANSIEPEELIERSFQFLLAREPKESILGVFDLSMITEYFPEYESSVRAGSKQGDA